MSSPRRYESAARAEAALQTRRRIVSAARQQLLHEGYHATTMSSLARRAEVSPQTIYNTIGSKTAVVKAVYDVLLAGDDEPIAMNDRPEVRAIRTQRSVAATLRAYAAFSRLIVGRVGALLGSLLAEGPGGDDELRDFLATIEAERRIGNTTIVTYIRDQFGLPGGLTMERAIDHVWTLTAPEVADRLVRRCHWSPDAYESWLSDQLRAGFRPTRVR
jgi:AcrR family transcriptional regulator